MEKYLVNLTDGRITREGNGFEFDYKVVVGEEKEVEGGFAFIGTDEEGNKIEAFLSEEEYFDGKEFVAGTKKVVAKKVVKSKIKAVKDIVAVNRIPYLNKEGKELTYLYAIGEEAIEETLEELDKIAGLVATLERYDFIEGRLGQITVRHDGSRRSDTILEIYILKADKEEAKEEEPTVAKVEGVVDLVEVGTKVIVVCLEGSKNFTKRMSYKGTVHGIKGHYRLKGDNGKYYIVKAERFAVRNLAENKPAQTNREKVEELAKAEGLVVGCWDKELDSFTEASIKHIINRIDIGSATDIIVRNNMKDYVVSVDFVEGEIDFTVWNKEEYVRLFGLGKFLDY